MKEVFEPEIEILGDYVDGLKMYKTEEKYFGRFSYPVPCKRDLAIIIILSAE